MGARDRSSQLLRLGGRRFVGRQAELGTLRTVLDQVEGGPRRLLEVSGEAGTGKTSLLAQLATMAGERGFAVLYGGAQTGPAAPYQPIVEAVRGHAATRPDFRLRQRTLALATLLPDLVAEDADVPGTGWLGPDAELGRRPLFDAVVALLVELATDAPAVLILDDIHWATPTTLDLIRHVAVDSAVRRLLVVTAHRVHEAQPAAELGGHLAELRRVDGGGLVVRIEVGGLEEADVRELTIELGGTPDRAAGVHARTNGNALFVSLLLQQELGSPTDADRAANALGDLIDAQVAALGDGARAVLDLAAVAGPQTPVRVLGEVLGGADRFFDDLDEAIASGLVIEGDGDGLVFAHDLVRDAVLAGQLASRRRARHRDLAAILGREPITPELLPVALHHHVAADDRGTTERCAEIAYRSAVTALQRLAPREAEAFARQGLALVEGMGATSPWRSGLLVVLADALHLAHDLTGLTDIVFAALDAAAESGEPELAAHACLHFRELLVIGEQAQIAFDHCEAALAGLGTREPALRAALLATMATMQALSGDPVLAPQLAADGVALARASEDDAAIGRALVAAYVTAWGTDDAHGQLTTAIEAYERGLRAGDMASTAYALRNRGVSQLFLGDRSGFELTWADLRRIGADTESSAIKAMDVLWAAMAAMLDGRWEDAAAAGASAMRLVPGDENIGAGVMSQTLWAGLEQGTAAGLAPLIQGIALANPAMPVYSVIYAYLLAEQDDVEGAVVALAPIAADGFAAIAHDWLRPIMYWFAGEIAWRAQNRSLAAALLPHVEPFAGQLAVAATATMVAGAFDRSIALLRQLVGGDEVLDRLDSALALERTISSRPLQARTLLSRAEVTGDRAAAAEAEQLATALGMATIARRAAVISRQ